MESNSQDRGYPGDGLNTFKPERQETLEALQRVQSRFTLGAVLSHKRFGRPLFSVADLLQAKYPGAS